MREDLVGCVETSLSEPSKAADTVIKAVLKGAFHWLIEAAGAALFALSLSKEQPWTHTHTPTHTHNTHTLFHTQTHSQTYTHNQRQHRKVCTIFLPFPLIKILSITLIDIFCLFYLVFPQSSAILIHYCGVFLATNQPNDLSAGHNVFKMLLSTVYFVLFHFSNPITVTELTDAVLSLVLHLSFLTSCLILPSHLMGSRGRSFYDTFSKACSCSIKNESHTCIRQKSVNSRRNTTYIYSYPNQIYFANDVAKTSDQYYTQSL